MGGRRERGPQPIDRRPDRAIAAGGIAAAGVLLLLGVLATLLPSEARRGIWLPVHLGIAGASSVAIAAMLPFFTASLAVAAPVRPWIRRLGVTLPLVGILAVAVGIAWGPAGLAVAGGAMYLAGIATVAYAALAPLARSTAPRRAALALAASAALADVAAGALVGTLYAAAAPWVLEHWGTLKPAHAWLNVLGFVGITVVTTLVHLWPTVVGGRIVAGRSGTAMGICWAVGPPITAAGLATGSDGVARAGAAVTIAGAASLAAFASPGGARADAGRSTCHGTARRSGTSPPASHGASRARRPPPRSSWRTEPRLPPGRRRCSSRSASAGSPRRSSARGRTSSRPSGPETRRSTPRSGRRSGEAWIVRLAAWQAGTALLVAGAASGADTAIAAGAALVGVAAVVSVGLLAAAMRPR